MLLICLLMAAHAWRSIFHRGGSSTRLILGRIVWLEGCGCNTGRLVRHWSASPHRIIACWQCSPCYTRGCCKTKACSGKLGFVVLAIAFLIEQDEFPSSSGFSRGLDAIHCCGRSTWRYRTTSHCTTCHVFVLFFAPFGTNLGKSPVVEHLAHGTGLATLVGRGCHRKGIRKSLFCRFETCNRGEFLRPSHRWWGYIHPLPRDAFSSWKGSWTSQTQKFEPLPGVQWPVSWHWKVRLNLWAGWNLWRSWQGLRAGRMMMLQKQMKQGKHFVRTLIW